MKGILFTEPLFYKVVSGEKTQTRRIIKYNDLYRTYNDGGCSRDEIREIKNEPLIFIHPEEDYEIAMDYLLKHSRCKLGERLYLKEPYRVTSDLGDILMDIKLLGRPVPSVKYKYYNIYSGNDWKNKLFMPAKFARYFIEITGVRVERLQDISDEDCIKEGIVKVDSLSTWKSYALPESPDYAEFYTPQQAYADLIDSISGNGTWESNPFVWVYDFKLTE
jgi:hypothetical protein